MKGFGSDVKHIDLADKNILDYTATSSTAFEPQPHIRTQKLTVGYQDIFNPSRHFAAHDEATMPLEYGTIINDDIFGCSIPFSAIFIFARFNTDSVVAYVKCAVDDNRIFTRFQIQTVTILRIGRISYLYTVQDYIFAHQRMDIPGWRILKNHALQKNISTFDKTDHHRT